MMLMNTITLLDAARILLSHDPLRAMILVDVTCDGGDHNLTRAFPSIESEDAVDALGVQPFLQEASTGDDTRAAFTRICADFADDPNGLVHGTVTLLEHGRETVFDLDGKTYPVVAGRYVPVELNAILARL